MIIFSQPWVMHILSDVATEFGDSFAGLLLPLDSVRTETEDRLVCGWARLG